MIQQLTQQLVREEGEVLHAYQDSMGLWTIGVGILIDERGGGISMDESRYLLANRLQTAIDCVKARWPWATALSDARFAVLVQMCYQMGPERLSHFTDTLALIEAGKYEDAAAAMLESKWAQQTPKRAHRVAQQMATGEWI